jgi:hypothetical protein
MSHSKTIPTLTISADFNDESDGHNIHEKWKRAASSYLATLEGFRLVSPYLLVPPGDRFVMEPPPQVGGRITESLLREHEKMYVKYIHDVEAQLQALHSVLWSMMGKVAKAALDHHPLTSKHDLKTPNHKKVRHFLKAIFLICTSPQGVSAERASVLAIRALVSSTMKEDDSLDDYLGTIESRNRASTGYGAPLSEKQLVVIAVDGLCADFAYHKGALIQALHVTNGSLPVTMADLRDTLLKIDANRPSGSVSAFAIRVDRKPKTHSKGDGKGQEDKDQVIGRLTAERDKLKKQVDSKENFINDLKEQVRKLRKRADDEVDSNRRGRGRASSPPPSSRDGKRAEKKVKFERREGGSEQDEEKQRKFQAGHNNKNVVPDSVKAFALKQAAEEDGWSSEE